MNKFFFILLIVSCSGCFGGGTRRTFLLEGVKVCDSKSNADFKDIHIVSSTSPVYLDSTKIIIRKNNLELSSFQESFWGEIPTTVLKRSLENSLSCLGVSSLTSSSHKVSLELLTLEIDLTSEKPVARIVVKALTSSAGKLSKKIFTSETSLEVGVIEEVVPVMNQMVNALSNDIALWVVAG